MKHLLLSTILSIVIVPVALAQTAGTPVASAQAGNGYYRWEAERSVRYPHGAIRLQSGQRRSTETNPYWSRTCIPLSEEVIFGRPLTSARKFMVTKLENVASNSMSVTARRQLVACTAIVLLAILLTLSAITLLGQSYWW